MKRYTPSPRALIHALVYAITLPTILAVAALLIDFSTGARMLAGEPRPAAPQPEWSYVYLPMVVGSGRGGAPVASTHQASMIDYEFAPKTITINAGDTIVWSQDGQAPHNVTASDKSWASPASMKTGESFSHTFTDAGTFGFYCTLHGTPDGKYMAGTVVVNAVVAPGEPTPTAAPPAAPQPTQAPAPSAAPAPPGSKSVSAQDFVFAPKTITITKGDTVNWTMDGLMPHTVTASDNSYDSGMLEAGQSYSRTFDQAGTFNYYCTLHGTAGGAGMAGTVIVQEPGAAPAPTATSGPPAPTATKVPPPPPAPPGTKSVSAANFVFAPKTISITKGDTVRWTMDDAFPHTVSATNGSFESGTLNQGQTYSRTFNQAGTFAYYCKLHGTANGSGMYGTVIVQEPGAAPIPTPTNAPPAPTATKAPPPPPAPPGTKSVSAQDFVFAAKTISITKGDTVRWTMDGQMPHTVTAANGSFDSGTLNQGQTYSRTFNQAGTFAYYCTLHGTAGGAGMAGVVVVNEPGAPPIPTPTNAPPAPTATKAPPPPPAPPGTKSVSAQDFVFAAKTISITKGDTVRWTMDGQMPHTVTAANGSFDSGTLNQGQTYSRTFNTAGTFAYYCTLHGTAGGSGMAGVVVVNEPGAPPIPTPTNAPPAPTSTPAPPPPPPPAGTKSVSAANFVFAPVNLVIARGDTVRWTMDDAFPHTVTASDGSFDSGRLNQGQTFSRTFNQVGTFAYYCTLHGTANGGGMYGTVTVGEAGAPPPPTPTPLPPTAVPPTPTPLPAAPAGTYNVQSGNNSFTPRSLTIVAGETVRWAMADGKPHTVTASDNSWGSPELTSGTWSKTFSQAGTFTYYCQLHGGPDGSGMAGSVTVLPAGSAPPPAQPTPPPAPAANLRLMADLVGGPAADNASGRAQYQARNGAHTLSIELRDGPGSATLTVYVDGASLGALTLDDKGRGIFTLDSANGDTFAPIAAGARLEIKTSSGGLAASATLQ